jgi:hypothetical protein
VGDPANDQVGSLLCSISWGSIPDNVLAWSVYGDNHREVCGPRGRRIAGTSRAHVLARARDDLTFFRRICPDSHR